MTAYYNEHDPKAAAWLRELIKQGHIAPGDVDERSIEDVRPDELTGYTQCHFFAGIGGWSYALRLAGWPDDRPVWTGSCPCQPFSAAGKGGGTADERHLWPAFHWLIAQCRPTAVFGEQVASKAGREWFATVRSDLEAGGYVVGAADLCAAGVGAPHIRQRLYFVGHAQGIGQRRETGQFSGLWTTEHGEAGDVEHPIGTRLERHARHGNDRHQPGRQRAHPAGSVAETSWPRCDWLPCRDGKARPVEPGTFPLAHGLPARVGRLRGYGNAIVPQVAAAFIAAAMFHGKP